MTVTQKKAYWVLPPSVKEVSYAPLSHINFLGRSGSLTALRSLSPLISPPLTTGPTTASTSRMMSLAPSQPSPPCSTVATPSSEEVGLAMACSSFNFLLFVARPTDLSCLLNESASVFASQCLKFSVGTHKEVLRSHSKHSS